jgi:hypothetical protein
MTPDEVVVMLDEWTRLHPRYTKTGKISKAQQNFPCRVRTLAAMGQPVFEWDSPVPLHGSPGRVVKAQKTDVPQGKRAACGCWTAKGWCFIHGSRR